MSVTLIVGDLHLGKSLSIGKAGIGTALNSRVIDQIKLLDWILEQAIEYHATNIIFTGDICEDVRPDYVLIIQFIQWLKRCEAYSVDIHIIMGNHDLKRTGSQYTSWLDVIQSSEVSNTSVYKQIDTIYNGTVGFTLVPFRDRRSFNCETSIEAINKIRDLLAYEANSIPDTYDKVVVGHLALEGSIFVGDEIDDAANELMCPVDMFQEYDYTWMGHVHKPQIRSQSPYVAHVGSLDISDFGETDHTKIIIVYDSRDPKRFKSIDVPSRPLRRLNLIIDSSMNTTQVILDELNKLDQKMGLVNSILRIEAKLLGPEVPNADRDKIEQAVKNYGVFHLCGFSEPRTVSVVPIEKKEEYTETVEPKTAVKMFADNCKFDSEDDKYMFIQMCFKVIDEFKESP